MRQASIRVGFSRWNPAASWYALASASIDASPNGRAKNVTLVGCPDSDKPFGTFTYTVSTMHCMSVSLANGGPGLGAAWGTELAMQMLKEAGFRNLRCEELPHDAINYYYTATPA